MLKTLQRTGRIAATKPNWANPVSLEYQFQTAVIRSHNGTEMRHAEREHPRVGLGFQTVLPRTGITRMMADLSKGQSQTFDVALPHRRTTISATALEAATAVQVVSVPFWLVAGAKVILTSATHEVSANVVSMLGSTVNLDVALPTDIESGATLHQALEARTQDEVDFRALSDGYWSASIDFKMDPGFGPLGHVTEAPATFESVEVFDRAPNWRSQPRITILDEQGVLDPGLGLLDVRSPEGTSLATERLTYTCKDLDEAESLVAFFHRMKGKRGSFWMPTLTCDLEPTANVLTGATSFMIAGADFEAAYSGSRVYNVVQAVYPDGSKQINRMVNITLTGTGDSLVSFADPWAADLPVGSRISWCPRWRFDTDRLEVKWQTSEVAEMQFAVRTVAQ